MALPVKPDEVGTGIVAVGGEPPAGAFREGSHQADGLGGDHRVTTGGAVAVDNFYSGVSAINSLVDCLLDFLAGHFPVLPGVDDVHLQDAPQSQPADRIVTLGAGVMGALFEGDSTGGAMGAGIGGTHERDG